MNILDYRKIHMVGIGGVGVSAIAEILLSRGYIVTGSDWKQTHITDHLVSLGAHISIGHSEENVDASVDLLVYTSAASEDNPELEKAKLLNIPCLSRSQMLGILMKDYSKSIAIAGAHGKSTTTSLTSVILDHTALEPTILVGADVKEIGGNAKVGKNNVLITEACEYRENFLDFNYNIGVVLNIDEDHLDYFRNLDHIISAFEKFAAKIPESGHLVINNDDYNSKKLIPHAKCHVVTFGINTQADFTAKNIVYSELGFPSFDVCMNDNPIIRLDLSVIGKHNIYNALASFIVARLLGVDMDVIKSVMHSFTGAARRFEFKGYFGKTAVIDDYAHHPSEIRATLDAVQKIKDKKAAIVFQPHTYTRTKELLEEFADSFRNIDKLYIVDIYAAREKDTGEIHSKDLVALLENNDVKVEYCSSFEEVIQKASEYLEDDHIFITMGAGNVVEIGEKLVSERNAL